MKLNIQKRVLPLLCVLALILGLGFGFIVPAPVANAWGVGDITENNVFYLGEEQVPIMQNTVLRDGGYDTVTYPAKEWPTAFNFQITSSATNYSLYSIDFEEDVFQEGYGCGVLWSVPKQISGLNLTKARIYAINSTHIQSSYGQFDYVTGEVSVYQSTIPYARAFADDVECAIMDDSGDFYTFWFGGTVNRPFGEFAVVLYFDEVDSVEFSISNTSNVLMAVMYSLEPVVPPSVDGISVSPSNSAPYYPGSSVEMDMTLTGTGIVPGSPESTVYWYIHGNTSEDTYLDADMYGDAVLYIANDETATSIDIEVISTYDTTKSAVYTVPITYPLEGVSIVPGGTEYYPYSSKDRTIQYSLLLSNGDPYEYEFIEWIIEPTAGHEEYFTVDDVGMVTIKGGAPAGSGYTLRWCYAWDAEKVAPGTAAFTIISNDEAILDGGEAGENLGNKGGELDDKNDQMGGAMDELNNAQGALPTLPGDASTLVDVGLLDNSITLMTTILDYEAMGLGDLFPVLGLVAGLAVLLFIIFGKTGG